MRGGRLSRVGIDTTYALPVGDHGVYIFVVISHDASNPASSLVEYRMTWWPRVSNGGDNCSAFFDRVIVDDTRNWVQMAIVRRCMLRPHSFIFCWGFQPGAVRGSQQSV